MFDFITQDHNPARVPCADGGAAGMDVSILMRVLDEIDYGVVLVDGNGSLRYANQLALREMLAGGPLRLGGGRVHTTTPADQHVLSVAIADAVRGRRKLFTASDACGSLPVAVVPMHGAADGEALALLVLGRRSAADSLTVDFYARSNGLTCAEALVLQRMCVGLKPKEVAKEQGVAISTVRSHICSIRTKTQTGSIRELLNRIAVLPPITPVIKAMSVEHHREPATAQ
ncbi:helix-turn-helix transcriptional regulator [Piscinibacter terrae]|nr:LuxR C-terminal-related transcriptional regulator [Albitalea terrae]